MNRSNYSTTRTSIRSNGIAYTCRIACENGDIETVTLCDKLANILKATDWLKMRQQWAARSLGDSKATIVKLTTQTAI